MEDLATSGDFAFPALAVAAVSSAKLDDGRPVTFALYEKLLTEELAKIRAEYGEAVYDGGHFKAATELFMRMVQSEQFSTNFFRCRRTNC